MLLSLAWLNYIFSYSVKALKKAVLLHSAGEGTKVLDGTDRQTDTHTHTHTHPHIHT
jgi:hypothetical protein